MISDAVPATRSWPRALSRIAAWALVGAFGGWLVGLLMYSYTWCIGPSRYFCYGEQRFKIGLLTAAGLVAGLLALRLRRSMTNRKRTLMTAAVAVVIVVLAAAASYQQLSRINPNPWGSSGIARD